MSSVCQQFTGKLVSFAEEKAANGQVLSRSVNISQVVTETELVERSNQLEQALTSGQFTQFCAMKAANCSDNKNEETFWNFMGVNRLIISFTLFNGQYAHYFHM